MKKQILIPALALLGGALAFALRLAENRTGFEAETGLAISGNLPGAALIFLFIVLAAALAVLSRSLPKKDDKLTFPAAFPAPEAAMLMVVIMGVFLMALSGLADLAIGLGLGGEAIFAPRAHLLLGVFSLASAAGVFLGAVSCRRADKAFNGTPLLASPAMLVVRLVLTYRVSSTDPTLAAYYVELLALVFLTLGLFRLSAFAFGDGRTRPFVRCSAMAVVFSLASLAEWGSHVRCISSVALCAGGGAVLLGFLFLRLNAPEGGT